MNTTGHSFAHKGKGYDDEVSLRLKEMKLEIGSLPGRRCTNHGATVRRRVTCDPHLRLGKGPSPTYTCKNTEYIIYITAQLGHVFVLQLMSIIPIAFFANSEYLYWES